MLVYILNQSGQPLMPCKLQIDQTNREKKKSINGEEDGGLGMRNGIPPLA